MIKTKKGLQELKKRYQEKGCEKYRLDVIDGCIKDGFAMDKLDYENTPKELRSCRKGLK